MNLTLRHRTTLGWLAVLLVLIFVVWMLAPVLTPFIVGAMAAYALHPAAETLAKRGVPRALAVLLVVVVAAVAMSSLMLLTVPILAKELPLLKQQLPLVAEKLNQGLGPLLAKLGLKVALDVESMRKFIVTYLNANTEDLLATALSSLRIGSSVLMAVVGNLFLMPVVLFYLLFDWPNVVARLQSLVPPRHLPAVLGFADECDAMLGQYLRGQGLVMLIMAAFYSAGLGLAGFDLAVPVGVFTGLAVFIPYLGFGIGLVLALVAGLLQFEPLYGLGAVALVYGAGQLLESLVVTPRLLGERINMSPLSVIFALLAFGHLLGFVGVLLALPASALIQVALARVLKAYRASALYGEKH
jgi:predicted PurR-regulated permease PerM